MPFVRRLFFLCLSLLIITTFAQASNAPTQTSEVWALEDAAGRDLYPIAILSAGSDLYFLGIKSLYRVNNGLTLLGPALSPGSAHILKAEKIEPPAQKINSIPVHEFSAFAYLPQKQVIAITDKSGDIFQYDLKSGKFASYPLGKAFQGYPDPCYVDICPGNAQGLEGRILGVDPERNQIWIFPSAPQSRVFFKEILPWLLKPGNANVSDAQAIAAAGYIYVARKQGRISCYLPPAPGREARLVWSGNLPETHVRPTHIYANADMPLYLVERENCRVLALNKDDRTIRQFVFPPSADLRGLLPASKEFYIINGHTLCKVDLSSGLGAPSTINLKNLDPRLLSLHLPVKVKSLPRHPGVLPGARRHYRWGVHEGIDFFNDSYTGAQIQMDSPVYAAHEGKIIRIDSNYHDLTAPQLAQMEAQCKREHFTSDKNEDLFRGRQIWIDHGGGLITRYAHLDNVRSGLKIGDTVRDGEQIAYVGVSGTGDDLPGRVKHPHLHFEIWLDGHYLGWGLTSAETQCLLEDLFSRAAQKGEPGQ